VQLLSWHPSFRHTNSKEHSPAIELKYAVTISSHLHTDSFKTVKEIAKSQKSILKLKFLKLYYSIIE
jgi:hypothetical protein